jgi:CheY-like chemotaxis protein
MDIRMPDMSGLDATRIIKEVNPDIPVVALSAYAFDENIREAREAGCDEFMSKPFRVEDLLDTVQRYVHE